jgi:lysophospholipase L1-like esterase
MAGFPYEFNATAPALLRDRLQTLLPQYSIEVVNVGLSAVGSYVVADFMPEVMRYSPDCVVVYVGHNEFYGAYGAGSVVTVQGPGWLTRLSIALLRFKTFLLLRDAYSGIFQRPSSKATTAGATLMEQVVNSPPIPYRGTLYNEAQEVYGSNIRRIIREAKSHAVPILFCSLVSNIRTQPPFTPMFSGQTDSTRREHWEEALAAGDSDEARGQWANAIAHYRAAIGVDSANALAFYRLGQACIAQGDYPAGRSALVKARDLDGLRFRATEDFQRELFDVCRSEHVPVARVDSAFDASSPHGIPGSELLLEHLHPNVEGYALMASVILRSIAENRLLVQPEDWHWSADKTDGEYMALSMVSEFDRKAAAIKIGRLTHRWPFTTTENPYLFIPESPLDRIILRYAQTTIPWSQARYEFAQYYAGTGQYGLARRECLAVAKAAPYSYEPLLRVADYYRQEGKNDSARATYLRSVETEDNPFARMKLAIIMLEQGDAEAAATSIEEGFKAEQRSGYKLPLIAAGNARYLLGVAYAQLQKYVPAKENLARSVAIDPTNADARELLRRIEGRATP